MTNVLKEVVLTGFYTKDNPNVRFDYFTQDEYEQAKQKGYIFTNPEDFENLNVKPVIKYEN